LTLNVIVGFVLTCSLKPTHFAFDFRHVMAGGRREARATSFPAINAAQLLLCWEQRQAYSDLSRASAAMPVLPTAWMTGQMPAMTALMRMGQPQSRLV
jgi:hypothetical protein